MKPGRSVRKLFVVLVCSVTMLNFSDSRLRAQQKKSEPTSATPFLTRTTTRHETRHFSYGGTVTVVGAPQGSVTVEGWSRDEVEVTANIELQAPSEEDLNIIAAINKFVLDEDLNHLSVLTTGTQDKVLLKRVAKDFPKRLLGLPWKIDYRIRIPALTDLEINAGRGAIKLSGVEGAIQISAAESEASLTLSGGTISVTVAAGKVSAKVPVRSWRGGGGTDIRVAAGEVTLEIPSGFNGDLDAEILRSGHIEDTSGALTARERPGLSPQKVKARAGAGGAFFQLTVGVGNVYIKKAAVTE